MRTCFESSKVLLLSSSPSSKVTDYYMWQYLYGIAINWNFLLHFELEGKLFFCHDSHISLKFSFINGCEWEVKIELVNVNKVEALIMEEIVDYS